MARAQADARRDRRPPVESRCGRVGGSAPCEVSAPGKVGSYLSWSTDATGAYRRELKLPLLSTSVCGMNVDVLGDRLDGMGPAGRLEARLAPEHGYCCVLAGERVGPSDAGAATLMR